MFYLSNKYNVCLFLFHFYPKYLFNIKIKYDTAYQITIYSIQALNKLIK